MKPYHKPPFTKDLCEHGQIVLAHGEVTGHHHSIYGDVAADTLPTAEYFEELSGRRVLLVLAPCVLRHQEHAPIHLDPMKPIQVRQGDVFLNPIGQGAWEVIRQRQYSPEHIRHVED